MTSSIEFDYIPVLGEGLKVSIKMPQKCTVRKIIKGESEFNRLSRKKDKEVGLAKSCKECNFETYGNKKNT